eukprot:GHRQ01032215.1.p1 GENE.GHRQ01032215.1~~GHRQ01032215.1.p1  ORF type:complete len:111 (-),score=2.16 GHRQ01032215.1:352-684(-)
MDCQPAAAAPTCSHAFRSLLSLTGILVRFSAYSQPSMRCVPLNTMLNPPLPSSLTWRNSELQAGRQAWHTAEHAFSVRNQLNVGPYSIIDKMLGLILFCGRHQVTGQQRR